MIYTADWLRQLSAGYNTVIRIFRMLDILFVESKISSEHTKVNTQLQVQDFV